MLPKGRCGQNSFKQMKKLGFKVSKGEIVQQIDSSSLEKKYLEWHDKSQYEIDGLVVSQNEPYERSVDKNPKYSVAFKIFSEGIKTEVIDIEWNPSKFGVLFPTVLLNPIKFDGVTVKRASGKNAKFIKDNGIGIGSEILVSYSGGVIPEIIKIIKKKSPRFPSEKYHWNDTEVNIILNDPLKNQEVNIQRLLHMFSVLNIKGISLGIVKKFYENGLTTLKSVYKSSVKDFLKLPGVKDKTAEKLYESIHIVLDEPINLSKIMTLSLVFGNGLAEKKLNLIVETFPNILETYKDMTTEDIINIEGFSDKLATVFLDNIKNFVIFMKENNYIKIKKAMAPIRIRKAGIKMNVVFSGFRDNELKEQIVEEGGKVLDSITKNVDWLVVKEISETKTGKVKKAEDMGIKIITKEQFKKKILFN